MNREQAMTLLKEHTKNEGLIKHALAVEAAMRHFARKSGENEEEWGIVGLLHDLDYEAYPAIEEHSLKSAEMLEAQGLPEHVCRAVRAHNDYHGIERKTALEKTLFAVDELCGFITAVALVKGKDLSSVKPKSVVKKLKDKAFARKVSREDIQKGIEELGIERSELIQEITLAMLGIADELGLKGTPKEEGAEG
ncbi:MAG: HDIG domain-containing metalloprotein [Planctomycetota bacterium]|jgi:putative nucleotidyltransferase with HDIG domain